MGSRVAVLVALGVSLLGARHLPIQVYTTAQGLPRNLIECMTFTPNGMLWLCTSEGLARFDGYHFQIFGPDQGLPARRILDMAPSRRGGYWLVSAKGVCRFSPGSKIGEPCRLLDSGPKVGQFFSDTILESTDGNTWIADGVRLYRVSADRRRLEAAPVAFPHGEQITMLADGAAGDLLVSTDFHLYSWKPGGAPRLLSESVGAIGCLQNLLLASGDLLIGATNGLFRLTYHGNYMLARVAVDGITRVNAVLRRRDGSIWIGGNGGIERVDFDAGGRLETLEHYTAEDGLPSSEVVWLTEDVQGNLWGATEGAGIFRVAAGGFVTYFARDGLGSTDRIASLFEDGARRLVVEPSWGSDPRFVVRTGDRFQEVPVRHPAAVQYFGWGWNQLSVRASDGEWWVPSGQGMLRFPKLARTEDISRVMPRHYAEQELGCREVFRLFEDTAGDVWLSCLAPARKLMRWRRSSDRFQTFGAGDGWLEDAVALAIRQAPDGTIWIGSGSSVFRFRGQRFERFLPAQVNTNPSIRDLMVDHAGRVWVATDFEGLFRCDNTGGAPPMFRQYTSREGLSTNSVQTLQEDGAGFIYAGTAAGVDRIDPQAPVDSRRIRHFTNADGLPDTQLTTSFRDSRGHLWFGSLHGLAEFDPSRQPRHAPPPVYVMRVRVRGEEVLLPWEGTRRLALDLAAGGNQIEVDYAGVDPGSAGSLHYQYRLEGVDRGWSAPVDRLSVNYASLPSGSFRFEVRAVDADGQASPQPAAIDLTVAAPLWRRWWFVTGVPVLLALAIVRIYDYRLRSLLAVERLRTRIATDLHDDIGASLTQISILSELARRSYAPQVLADVANIARDLVQDMSDIVWAVNPRHDRFEGLVHRMRRFASDTLGGAEIGLEFEADELPPDFAVPLDVRRPLYLVFKEAVNNVARHSGAARAAIRLSLDHNRLKLVVEDNGRGFDPAAIHAGEGLASIARRLRELDGTAVWEPPPGGGTRFTAAVPLRARASLPELVGFFRRLRR
jgi:ligand-binding sensor domain-containing protein/two-component sensor histidine kinase